jgi:hypothetical protein
MPAALPPAQPAQTAKACSLTDGCALLCGGPQAQAVLSCLLILPPQVCHLIPAAADAGPGDSEGLVRASRANINSNQSASSLPDVRPPARPPAGRPTHRSLLWRRRASSRCPSLASFSRSRVSSSSSTSDTAPGRRAQGSTAERKVLRAAVRTGDSSRQNGARQHARVGCFAAHASHLCGWRRRRPSRRAAYPPRPSAPCSGIDGRGITFLV